MSRRVCVLCLLLGECSSIQCIDIEESLRGKGEKQERERFASHFGTFEAFSSPKSANVSNCFQVDNTLEDEDKNDLDYTYGRINS